jgi:hypothetical protein
MDENSSGKLAGALAQDAAVLRGAVGDTFGVVAQNLSVMAGMCCCCCAGLVACCWAAGLVIPLSCCQQASDGITAIDLAPHCSCGLLCLLQLVLPPAA